MEIQSIAFNRKNFDLKNSVLWLIDHKFEPTKYPDVTDNWIRFRLLNPEIFEPKSFRTKKVEDGSVLITFALKKKEKKKN